MVLGLLESQIQSGDNYLLGEGMKLIKVILQHATQYEVEVSFPSSDTQSKVDSFHSSLLPSLFSLTYELYDSSSENMNSFLNQSDDAFSMLYLRFLAQNNETTPYRVIANAIEKSQHKPKDFDVMNRYMMILIVQISSRRDA